MERHLLFPLTVACMLGCSEPQQFYLPTEQQVFQQNRSSVNRVIDVLWVIDNSGSMESSQANLANNLDSFIGQFVQRNLSFKMAFTSSDAYLASVSGDASLSLFRDGSDQFGHSNTPIIADTTPNPQDVFLKNARLGTKGAGDERMFQSLRETLVNPGNQNFLRPNSFFSVILISDEEDYSWDGTTNYEVTSPRPALHPVSRYVDFLDAFTFSPPGSRKYNVNTISVLDQNCLTLLNPKNEPAGQKIGQRYMQLADATGGLKGDICSNFADTLNKIAGKILELITQFKLNRIPDVDTITVSVNGTNIPNNSQNGWTYEPTQNAVFFHGKSVPAEGETVIIDYQPANAR